MLRPDTARWFELLTSREQLGEVLDTLARTRSVQLQTHSQAAMKLPLADLRGVLAQYETFARRHATWWPGARLPRVGTERPVIEAPQAALASVQAWARAAAPVIAELESLAVEQADLVALTQLCAQARESLPRLDRMASAGPVLASGVYALPPGTGPLPVPPALLLQYCAGAADGTTYLLAVGTQGDVVELDAVLSARKARRIALPNDLPSEPAAVLTAIETRQATLRERESRARAALQQLDAVHALPEALGELSLAAWLVAHVPELPVTEHFAWVTGWCADRDDTQLRRALDAHGLHYLLRTPPTPSGLTPPSVLRNPRWARPFEAMTAMMGLPAAGEADPSIVVAILAPLMFGFMFGDVVHGAIVAVAGAWLGRRVPALRLLVPGGLLAIVFGVLFGSVFTREDVIPALWLHPLERPLPVLGVALAFGVFTILVGLLLDALQHAWQGKLRHWLLTDAGIVVAYLGIVSSGVVGTSALWAIPIGFGWTLTGAALANTGARAGAAAHAVGEALERTLQLAVNTLSFVRVGAFALAHAGLSAAVVGIADIAGAGYWPVLILGNAAILVLEGLVVCIQTTRLVLFEFFIRFLTAGGRPFEPLAPPPVLPGGTA